MDIFAIDDAAQRRPTRDGMGPLVAVGGLRIPGDQFRQLELDLDALCKEYGFPPAEEFKWSPDRDQWMHDGLKHERRKAFFLRALARAKDAGVVGTVVMADVEKKLASKASASHEDDVTMMFLERAQNVLKAEEQALVLFDRPSGDRKSEHAFLSACLDRIRSGTAYTTLDRLVLPVSADSKLSRALQLADVVVSCATSYVSGEDRWSPPVFKSGVLPILRSDYGCCGGRGLKIHPDFRYGNLYHWLLGDEDFVRYQTGFPLPSGRFTAYRKSATEA